ncbi:bisanhydrobacterioruberin hydratase CruF [Methanobacterium alkalithermotolerans]|uniref:bisanhydrobacterioruberin hydratase CruF n=1 Tax=Methanobacterium alkalithermotolerans TaxID=2731220 RepID=UPI00201326EB|nr:bisanhydrobacterioruberin hydratase CruF [Methanobacterium alkalithermotolerans]
MKDYSKIIYIWAIALLIAAFFVANVEIGPETSIISVIFIISLAIPSFTAVVMWLGWRKGLALIAALSAYALVLETLAILTGIPYSEFYYNELIGTKIFGTTPFTVPFAWLPLFIGSLYLASELKIKNKKLGLGSIIVLSTILVVITDLVLDPGAVALQFWVWKDQGIFYDVPLMNFIGWVLTGFLASLIAVGLLGSRVREKKPEALASSLLLIMFFWSGICIYLNLIIPALIGIGLIIFIIYSTKGRIGNFEI